MLERGKPLLLRDDLAALRLIQCFERFFKRCALPLLPFLAAGLRRAQEDFGGMRIFQQQAAQKRLIISCADGGAQIVEHLAEAQAGGGVAACSRRASISSTAWARTTAPIPTGIRN